MGRKLPTVKVGDVFPTTHHGDIEVIEYENSKRVTVRFQDGTTRLTSLVAIRLKSVKNFFTPTVRGIGYLGYDPKDGCEGSVVGKHEYIVWTSMIRRCYDQEHHITKPHYADCTVAPCWHNFKTFSHWYKNQFGHNLGWQLDKDLTLLGNKTYSPETCSLVPHEINNLTSLKKMSRGELPVGVHYDKRVKKYIAVLRIENEKIRLGSSPSVEEAFNLYKTRKEAHVRDVARKYKDVIPEAIYNNLMNFTVSITD